jgi:hypothetical protein
MNGITFLIELLKASQNFSLVVSFCVYRLIGDINENNLFTTQCHCNNMSQFLYHEHNSKLKVSEL